MNRLNQIRQLPCVSCFAPPPSQACHANWGKYGKGMGKKADDEYTIPLCASCHAELDQYKKLNREQSEKWFMDKWALVNDWLDAKVSENGVDF